MVAIDPPYRLDPWQNLVSIHWDRGTSEFPHQYFIFRRWTSGPINGPQSGPRFSGDWYPVSDQFVHDAYDNGEITLEFDPGIEISTGQQLVGFLTWTETRRSRKDLIKDGLSISLGISESDRTAWPGSFTFYYWDLNSIMLAWPTDQPSRSNPPNRWVYYVIVGGYEVDDMTSQDWADLASGVGAFDGTPQFTPP